MADWVYEGVASPRFLAFDIKPTDSLPDLSVVTGGSVEVTTQDGIISAWDLSIVSQSPTALRVKHVFAADGSDCATRGRYRMVITLLEGATEHRMGPRFLRVKRFG